MAAKNTKFPRFAAMETKSKIAKCSALTTATNSAVNADACESSLLSGDCVPDTAASATRPGVLEPSVEIGIAEACDNECARNSARSLDLGELPWKVQKGDGRVTSEELSMGQEVWVMSVR
ncbi:unnamed protein product [Rotaria magnacalcarata]|uniref:Uncharacterized protein n=1 Tax=Rotaria magnacalcarata TaxID=392030 RepID=A0A816UMM3_9BILA|nr:unnamed protein product [Rotaria magnacalcarata]